MKKCKYFGCNKKAEFKVSEIYTNTHDKFYDEFNIDVCEIHIPGNIDQSHLWNPLRKHIVKKLGVV